MPRITVIMPAFNAGKYISEAIESIISQTFRDFEFIIIDDGSTDETLDVVHTFNDKRISLVVREKNTGLPECINSVMVDIDSPIVARMDSDDYSYPMRFERQLQYISKYPHVGILSTSTINFDDSITIPTQPNTHDELKAFMMFRPPIMHPTIFVNLEAFDSKFFHYDESFIPAADYELWVRLMHNGVIFGNLDEFLYQYRYHDLQISYTARKEQIAQADRVRIQALRYLGVNPTKEQLSLHKKIAFNDHNSLADRLGEVSNWFEYLVENNNVRGYYDRKAFPTTLICRINYIKEQYTNIRHIEACEKISKSMASRAKLL